MTASCAKARSGRKWPHWSTSVLIFAAIVSPAAAAEPISVLLDQARIIKLPDRATTVVVGNPLIADVAVQPGGIAVVTAKGFGATNFVVLDGSGAVLMEKNFEVKWPSDNIVVVYRGIDRETYSCMPDCSRRIMLGDTPEYFDKTLAETATRNAQALGAATAPSH